MITFVKNLRRMDWACERNSKWLLVTLITFLSDNVYWLEINDVILQITFCIWLIFYVLAGFLVFFCNSIESVAHMSRSKHDRRWWWCSFLLSSNVVITESTIWFGILYFLWANSEMAANLSYSNVSICEMADSAWLHVLAPNMIWTTC